MKIETLDVIFFDINLMTEISEYVSEFSSELLKEINSEIYFNHD